MSPEPSQDVDRLRERLQSLGYLDAGVDRFVLAPARSDRGAWAITWRASARIGVLAGVLLGLTGTVALAGRMPGLLTGPRDAVVVALYLGAALGLLVTLGVLLTAILATRVLPLVPGFSRRAPGVAVAAGTLAGLGSLIYLTLLWRTVGNAAPVAWWNVVGLVVTAAISLLLGYATRLTVAALLVRDPSVAAQADTRHGWLWWIALGLTGLAGAGLLYAATTRPPKPVAAPPLVVVPTNLRLTVVAIDGFDAGFARAIVARGASPNLESLLSDPVFEIAPTNDADPVRVWTTIATGQSPARHGVEGLETRRVAGIEGRLSVGRSGLATALATVTDLVRLTRPTVTTGLERTERAFWEVASVAGLRTVTVNWWATWPAAAQDGTVLSDRAILRLQRGGALDREIAPVTLYDQLRSRWADLQRAGDTQLEAAWPRPPNPAASSLEALAREAVRLDALAIGLARSVAEPSSDVVTVYLPGLDIAQHALLGEPRTLAPSRLEERRAVLVRSYRTVADVLAPLLATRDRTVVLVALPGRLGSDVPGILSVRGPGTSANIGRTGLRAEDVAPTILFALGVPISRELEGRARPEIFAPDVTTRAPIRWAESWGRRTVETMPSSAQRSLDDEMRERLKSLGYVH